MIHASRARAVRLRALAGLFGAAAALAACGGGASAPGSSSPSPAPAPPPGTASYTVGGTVAGLRGSGLALSDGRTTTVIPAGATTFTLPAPFAAGAAYSIAIAAQESSRDDRCTLANGTGSVAAADVTGLALTCTPLVWHATVVAGAAHTAGDPREGTDGPQAGAFFAQPQGLAVTADGTIYVTEPAHARIRAIGVDGGVTTLAASARVALSSGAIGPEFSGSYLNAGAIAADGTGNLYFTDTRGGVVYKVAPGAALSTYAGQQGAGGLANGAGGLAAFDRPLGLAVDGHGDVFVADVANDVVREIAPDTTVSTFAGSGAAGSADGAAAAAAFDGPSAVAIAADGTLLVADRANNRIRRVATDGSVTTVAGSGAASAIDGIGAKAALDDPWALDVDAAGNVFVPDSIGGTLRKISAGDVVTTLALSPGTSIRPRGVKAMADGSLLVTDGLANQIVRLTAQ